MPKSERRSITWRTYQVTGKEHNELQQRTKQPEPPIEAIIFVAIRAAEQLTASLMARVDVLLATLDGREPARAVSLRRLKALLIRSHAELDRLAHRCRCLSGIFDDVE